MTPSDLKYARRALGLTQRELASVLRLGKDGGRAVRRWEGGDSPISGPVSLAIEAMLDGWRPVKPKIGYPCTYAPT